MTLSHGFRHLANVLETLENDGLDVLDVAAADDDRTDRLTIDMTVTVPINPPDEPSHTTPSDSGTEQGPTTSDDGAGRQMGTAGDVREHVIDRQSVSGDVSDGESPAATATDGPVDGLETESTDAHADADDADVVACPVDACDSTFENDHGMKIHRTKIHGNQTADTRDDAATYRDPDRLREVYDECNSFTEMKEALDTDVSAQTVRRQMIAHDIYVPGESGSGSPAGDPEREAGDDDATMHEAELDAIELPEGVTVADLKSGVSAAQTLYDVQRCFDLDRSEAIELLERYDLLNIVHGRVSDRDQRKEVEDAEITRRILEHAPTRQASKA